MTDYKNLDFFDHIDSEEIRRLYKDGYGSQRNLAKKFGVSQTTIWFVVTGINWKHTV